MSKLSLIWLAAEYHLPTTYSLRVPLTSANAAPSLPGPGPGTVRLASIRSGIELLGSKKTRDILFPAIRSAEIRIKPPARIGITSQTLRLYKANDDGPYQESIGYRELCHAQSCLTIFIQIPPGLNKIMTDTLSNIGYWGRGDGLAYCTTISQRQPIAGEYATPLASLPPGQRTQQNVVALMTDFRDNQVEWEELMPGGTKNRRQSALRYEPYLWPLEIIEQHSTHRLLQYRSLV